MLWNSIYGTTIGQKFTISLKNKEKCIILLKDTCLKGTRLIGKKDSLKLKYKGTTASKFPSFKDNCLYSGKIMIDSLSCSTRMYQKTIIWFWNQLKTIEFLKVLKENFQDLVKMIE